MIDRIEELLGRMAAENEEDETQDALALPGDRAAGPVPPKDRDGAEETQAQDGPGASEETSDGPDGPEIPEDEVDLSGLDEFDLPAPLLAAPERAESGAGDGPTPPAGPVEVSGGPAAQEPSLAGLEELYRETVRETLPSTALAVPQGGRGEFASRGPEPGSAASLAVDELDRAVRRDSRRYDGEMSIY